jgi:hypothetical protein
VSLGLIRKTQILAVSVLSITCAEAVAHASVFDVYGVGADGIAQASARAAHATDGSASFYNPGSLAFGTGYDIRISPSLGIASYRGKASGNEPPNPFGITTTLASDVPLTGPLAGKIRVGLALYALPDTLMRLRAQYAETPFFPYYDNRTQRLTVIPAIAFRPLEQLGIGMGANVFSGVQGPIDVREGQSRAMESRIAQEAGTYASIIAGVRYDLSQGMHLALNYRQQFGVPVKITTTASIGGVPLLVDISQTKAFFDPATLVLAFGYDPSEELKLECDLGYHKWSSWDGPLLNIDTTVSALSLSSQPPKDLFKDTYSARFGASWTAYEHEGTTLNLQGGVGYETSMLRADQRQGRTNFVDAPKLTFGLGASGRFAGVIGKALLLGIGAQIQDVGLFEQKKVACTKVPCPDGTVVGPSTDEPSKNITNPGYPTLSAAATYIAGSVTVGVEL